MSINTFYIAGTEYTDGSANSNSNNYFICNTGDTNRIVTQRVPVSSTDNGLIGEYCFGIDDTITYLYYCNSSNNWVRIAMSSF